VSLTPYPPVCKRTGPRDRLTEVLAASGWVQTGTTCQQEEKGAAGMADARNSGIGLGGILVIVRIVLAILLGHWWIGLLIILVGLLFFGGFAKGKWY